MNRVPILVATLRLSILISSPPSCLIIFLPFSMQNLNFYQCPRASNSTTHIPSFSLPITMRKLNHESVKILSIPNSIFQHQLSSFQGLMGLLPSVLLLISLLVYHGISINYFPWLFQLKSVLPLDVETHLNLFHLKNQKSKTKKNKKQNPSLMQ